MKFSVLVLLVVALGCSTPEIQIEEVSPEAISLLGDSLFSPAPSEALMARYEAAKAAFEADPSNIDNLIWYGRFTAYIGNYNEAIDIYSQGLSLDPNDARLYRHRGHRYITVRNFDQAIEDFEAAAVLIEGQPNEIEPDGMPNAQNIPVSTLQGNIWYHLGLAYYLKQDFPNALRGFSNGLATSENPDNVVSTSHWLYMIHRRMGHLQDAENVLNGISSDMDIIENHAYHQLGLFYKGELEEADLQGEGPANDAILYGIANWYYYNGHTQTAHEKWQLMVQSPSWASFGYIAAESDLAHLLN